MDRLLNGYSHWCFCFFLPQGWVVISPIRSRILMSHAVHHGVSFVSLHVLPKLTPPMVLLHKVPSRPVLVLLSVRRAIKQVAKSTNQVIDASKAGFASLQLRKPKVKLVKCLANFFFFGKTGELEHEKEADTIVASNVRVQYA